MCNCTSAKVVDLIFGAEAENPKDLIDMKYFCRWWLKVAKWESNKTVRSIEEVQVFKKFPLTRNHILLSKKILRSLVDQRV